MLRLVHLELASIFPFGKMQRLAHLDLRFYHFITLQAESHAETWNFTNDLFPSLQAFAVLSEAPPTLPTGMIITSGPRKQCPTFRIKISISLFKKVE